MVELNLITRITKNTSENVADALLDMASCDCDFNGENGEEYLWEAAEGFESNATFALSVAKEEPTTQEMITKFVDMWMGHDCYYEDYDVSVEEFDGVIAISVAYTTD